MTTAYDEATNRANLRAQALARDVADQAPLMDRDREYSKAWHAAYSYFLDLEYEQVWAELQKSPAS
jgi:hypothetical protein